MSITRGERPTELESRLHNFSALVALLTSVTAVALLAGWFLGIGWLVRPRPGAPRCRCRCCKCPEPPALDDLPTPLGEAGAAVPDALTSC